MKILYINVMYEPYIGGGAEIILKNLVQGISSKGHTVKVLSFWNNKAHKEEIVDGIIVYRAKIPNIYFPYGKTKQHFLKRKLWHILDIYNPIAKKIVLEQIADFKPDVISINNTQGWSCSIWDAIKEADIPSVQVLHDLYLLCPTNMFKNNIVCTKQCLTCKVMRLPYKNKSNNLKAVVGVSNFILEKLLSFDYFKEVPIKAVIYNSRQIIMDEYSSKKELKCVNFGFIGTLAPNKGIELLLKSYFKIKKQNYKLYIAGSGTSDYEEYLKNKYQDDSIIFMGRVEPEIFFEKVDVTIIPSMWYENFPGVIVESLSYGIPVIGSNIGGIPEMINNNINGMLFNPYKENELIQKMIEFEKELHYWRNNTHNIQCSGQKYLNYDKWINDWEALYKQLIRG